jgi:hypothetical protein
MSIFAKFFDLFRYKHDSAVDRAVGAGVAGAVDADDIRKIVGDDERALRIVASFDKADKAHRTRGVDGGGAARNKGYGVVQFSVTGTAPAGSVVSDEAWFFAQLGAQLIDATFAIATMTPTFTRFTNAQVADWFTWNPTYCAAANITSVSSAAVLSSMQLRPQREDVYGSQANDAFYQASFQTADQYQTQRGQFPIDDVIDGYTYFALTNTATNPAASYVIAWFFGPRYDRRVNVPRGTPVNVLAPGHK